MRNRFMASVLMLSAAAVLVVGVAVSGAGDAPKLKGIAYVAGHGGHLAVLDLATGSLDRIVISEPTTLDGKTTPAVGTHGQALIGDNLYVGMLNGDVIKVDRKTQKSTNLGKVGKKLCGAIVGPDGNIYYEDMADGNVYAFDPKKDKAADVIPVGKSVCGIGWDKAGKYAFVSDMPLGTVFVLDWKTKKVTKEIKDVGTFLHQGRTNPSKTEFWVTAGNEFKQTGETKEAYATAGKGKSEIVIIDTAKQEIKDRIELTDEGAYAHDLAFTPDGKYALVTARTYADDSILMVIDTKTRQRVGGQTSLCFGCHEPAGVKVTIDKGSPLLCGIEMDWGK